MRRIPIRGVLLASTLSLAQWLLPAFAQQPFPVKPARMISPYAPGGGNDVLCRIVENRPGANAIVGTEVTARAAPDGYTFVLISSAHASDVVRWAKVLQRVGI